MKIVNFPIPVPDSKFCLSDEETCPILKQVLFCELHKAVLSEDHEDRVCKPECCLELTK